MVERRRLRVHGVVQGVGFRPFVYRTAVSLDLTGSVRNLGDAGVEVLLEGPTDRIEAFVQALRTSHPPLARVESVEESAVEPEGSTEFAIIASGESAGAGGSLPPDTSLCDACAKDLLSATRYEGYWAISCTDCGPRFTVIEGLPYDRPYTSMVDFPMCDACAQEYTDPLDRRYHAQTIACETCGPSLSLDGEADDPIGRAADALCRGEIVAIKGIGGTHIACDATNDVAVAELRRRLGRPGQAYAVMATEKTIPGFASPEDAEWDLLRSPRRPIVVLTQTGSDRALSADVAPGLHTVGVMLPYTGLHVLLMDRVQRPLVMTSANLPGLPMLIDNEEIRSRLTGIADRILLHNRRIVARSDDSVQRRSGGRTLFIRRSRGYVPEPFSVDLGMRSLLATGPDTGVTFALYRQGAATVSQHIGSVDQLETYEFFREAVEHLGRLTSVRRPEIVACDLHPRFLTTAYAHELAERTGSRVVRVQHHAAHLCSVMGEKGLDAAVGIVLDGYGYGQDGSAWGGEILTAKDRSIVRAGSLMPFALPGGDRAARFPLRVAASLLTEAGVDADRIAAAMIDRGMASEEASALRLQLERRINTPMSTSAGRFLDAVAAWLGICVERTYEGEPAMRLEATAVAGRVLSLPIRFVESDGLRRLDTTGAFLRLTELAVTHPMADIAATAQAYLAEGMAALAIEEARAQTIDAIAFSGGVAINDAIATRTRQAVESAGLRFETNERVPCGDGGVSFGQAVYAGQGWTF